MSPINLQAQDLWDRIRNPQCTECLLHKTAQTVCLMGDGPVPCDVMIVGEAPGWREDDVQRPFAGKSGKFLDQVLEDVGLSRSTSYLTNVNKCRPPDNRTPSRLEIKACRHYLDDEIEAVKPKFILLVGNSALSVIKKSGIMRHRGEMFAFDEAKVLPTVHPAAVLRNPHYEQLFRTDLATFARLVRGEKGAPPPKTYLIRDHRGLQVVCKAILASEAVAYDLETTGHEDLHPDAAIVTIGVATKPGTSFVVPIGHPERIWGDAEHVLRTIGHALAYTNARRIAHNAKFDDRWLARFGLKVHADFDTMIAAHILDENRLKGLKPLAQMLLGVDPWKDVDLGKGGALTTSLSKLSRYNARDADYTLRLYYLFRGELVRPGNERTLRLFAKLLMPALRVLTQIELHGMWLDRERLLKRTIEVKRKLEATTEELDEIAGEPINWNSPAQVAEILFGKLGLPMFDLTKGGAASTKESVMLRLRKEHRAAELLIERRKWAKYLSTYFLRWAEVADKNGRIHPNYKVTGTVTGRLSSGKEEGQKGRGLNVQQVPRDPLVRGVVGAPRGWRFVEADFSQIELRIAAHLSRDKTMQRYFQLGDDIHLRTAMSMTSKSAKAVTKEERKKAKAVNFGFLFGMGARKFVEYARDNYDLEVPLEEAEQVRRRFFEEYNSIRAWHERQRRLVQRYHRVQSPIGRVRHLPDVDSPDKEVRAEAERQAINSPVQSMASDMMLLSMVLLHEQMDPQEAVIVGTIHDSLLFEIRKDVVDKWVPIIRQTMENLPLKRKFGVDLSVPIQVDVKVSQHWGDND